MIIVKKILFSAYDMSVGGIETALLTLLNDLVNRDYEITLVLEHQRGIFLSDLDPRINVISYTPSEHKNSFLRKVINLGKRIHFFLKHYHRYDFAGSFATYSRVGSFVARMASKNNALWGHADYLDLFYKNKDQMRDFFSKLRYDKFKHIVFVSRAARDSFISVYPEMKDRTIYCNNLIDYKKIERLAKENVSEMKGKTYTFLNIGRHEERQKKLTRIIEAAKRLKKDKISFQIWFVGDGPDTKMYQDLVKKYRLEKEIIFLGRKKNPYPYFRLADSILLTSDYEGYPVVFVESFILGKPILTTDISDARTEVSGKYGVVVDKEIEEIYQAMRDFVKSGYTIKTKFNAKKFNEEVIRTIESLI